MTSRAMTPTMMTSRAMTPRAKTPRVATPRAQSLIGQMPAPTAKGKLVTIEAPSSDSKHSESSPMPSKSSLSTLQSELGRNDKISKPSGEAGGPGHGVNKEWLMHHNTRNWPRRLGKEVVKITTRNNLEEQLGWGGNGFKSLKAVVEFPDLSTFKNCWPVLDLIQMHLKYLSSRAQQEKRIADGSARLQRKTIHEAGCPKSKPKIFQSTWYISIMQKGEYVGWGETTIKERSAGYGNVYAENNIEEGCTGCGNDLGEYDYE
ncbi:hypothetical protein EV401DRAFT_1893655 [Pisolithus croceorrhizus]|nr:hypothetical protein EV401DRAFT_1893655 [Pisolithus croceorrhizus]